MLTRDDVLWVLRNLLELRAGFWPERGWSDISGVKLQRYKEMYSNKSCEMASEVELKLKQCGLDGFLAKQIYAWNEDQDYLSLLCKGDIQRRADYAIKYISSKWPRDKTYNQTKADWEYRRRKNDGIKSSQSINGGYLGHRIGC